MILAFELTYSGTVHAPGNSATLQTISQAFPSEEIRVFSDDAHSAELQKDVSLTRQRNVRFHSIPAYSLYVDKPGVVSLKRLIREITVIWRALRKSPKEHCLIVLLSSTPTAIFAVSWLTRLFRSRPMAAQVLFHGNLAEIRAARSRNPLRRCLDLISAIVTDHGPLIRFLVLEKSIKNELVRLLPAVGSRVDVLPLPSNPSELHSLTSLTLTEPVRIGFVGLATNAKGIDTFLRIARKYKQIYRHRIEFHHIGKIPPSSDSEDFSILDSRSTFDQLPREDFVTKLSQLHYLMLPFRQGYYDLSASGALLDALTWNKPIIATRLPLVAQFFDEFGEIGFLCDGETQLGVALDTVMQMDRQRYSQQVQALAQGALQRTPNRLAQSYQSLVTSGYPASFSRVLNVEENRTLPTARSV